jgi:hypothetical protein
MAELKVAGTWVPTDKADPDGPTHLSEYGKGGLRSVNTLVDRNVIFDIFKEEGMLVYVKEDKKTYQLQTDNSWKEFSSGSGPSPETKLKKFNVQMVNQDETIIKHNFNSRDIIVTVYEDKLERTVIIPQIVIVDDDNVLLSFSEMLTENLLIFIQAL